MRRSGYDKDDAPVAVLFTQVIGAVLAIGCFPTVIFGLCMLEQDTHILFTGYAMAAMSWLIRIVLPIRPQK